jgi:hypothetical protein
MSNEERTMGFSDERWIIMNLNNGFWQAELNYKNKNLSFCHQDMDSLWQVKDLIDGFINLVEDKNHE